MSRLIDVDKLIKRFEVLRDEHETHSISYNALYEILVKEPTAFDTEKVVEQLENVLQDLNVIEVIDHIDFDSTIQTSLENFLNAFKSEIMRIVKNNACIDELLKGEEG